jgi:hypothetical protein
MRAECGLLVSIAGACQSSFAEEDSSCAGVGSDAGVESSCAEGGRSDMCGE